jgi:transposase
MLTQENQVEIRVLARQGMGIRPRPKDEPLIRFETAPGEQMQVDFVVFRRGGQRLFAFVATLGYSRMSFVRFVEDESWPTLRACLEAAFGYFGGVPREVLFDNMKTVVLERNAYGRGRHRLHPGLLALSRDLGFAVRLCRPYRAKTKGKVERFNRYLRDEPPRIFRGSPGLSQAAMGS